MRTLALWISLLSVFFGTSAALAHQPHDVINDLAVSSAYDADQTIFASVSAQIVKSSDGGVTWAPSQAGLPYGTAMGFAVSPDFSQDGVVFVGLNTSLPDKGGFVFRTSDEGTSWEDASSGLPGSNVLSIAVSPDFAADQSLFAGTAGDGVFGTVDAGASWTSLNPGAVGLMINVIAVSPDFATDQTVFAGTGSGLLKSTDGGQNWTSVVAQGTVEGLALSPDYAQDQTVFVGISGGGIFRSQNGGASWQARNNGLSDLAITSLAFSPDYSLDQTLLASTVNSVFRTTDDGDLWTPQTEGLARQDPLQCAVHHNGFSFSPTFGQDRTVYLASCEGAHRSVDGADTWRQLDLVSQTRVRGLDVSPDFANDQTVFAGTYGSGAYRSVDGGDGWTAIDTGLEYMFMQPIVTSPAFATDHTVFLGYFQNLAKSTSRGEFWTNNLVAPLGGFVSARKLVVSPDFANDSTLFIADDTHGDHPIYRSVDGGSTFVPLDPPFESTEALAISPDFGSDGTLFAASFIGDGTGLRGIYRSVDGGNNWNLVHEVFGVFGLALSPAFQSDGTVLAGLANGGVLRSTDGGDSWVPVNLGLEPITTIEPLDFSPDFATDQTIFIGSYARGVYKSTDGGDSWTQSGLPGHQITALAVSPDFAADQTVFAGSWDGTYRSTDGGATWNRVQNIRRIDDHNEYITRSPNWVRLECLICTNRAFILAGQVLSRAEFIFAGNSITWIGERAPFAGIANVYLDDVLETQVDLYAPQMAFQQVLFNKTGLGPGEHKITIEVSGDMNPASTGKVVFLDALEVGY